jgi:hypothetical protein
MPFNDITGSAAAVGRSGASLVIVTTPPRIVGRAADAALGAWHDRRAEEIPLRAAVVVCDYLTPYLVQYDW